MALYMNCGSEDARSDLFAFNDYEWCDPSSFTSSGWSQKVEMFSGYGLPLFLSEYGCNTNQRQFQEVGSLYSDQMTPVFSGGLVYEYSNEDSNYGLVDINGGSVSERPDFTALQNAFNKTPNPQGDGGYNHTGGASACPPKQLPAWNVDGNALLPAIPVPALKFMKNGAGKGIGLSGSGSQTSGTQSTGAAEPGSGDNVPTSTGAPPSSVSQSTGGGSGSESGGPQPSGSAASSSPKGGAATTVAPPSMAVLVCGLITVLSTLFGASIILI